MFEDILKFESLLSKKKILITGNTGFTGCWAHIWLQEIGAEVMGYSLPPETEPSLYSEINKNSKLNTTYSDIRDYKDLDNVVSNFQPEVILHLAAQSLVRRSYSEVYDTMLTNVVGTLNILEIARKVDSVKGVLCVTTDKVYKNINLNEPFKETDSILGSDPYSSSKAAAEMVIQGYSKLPNSINNKTLSIASARGGNIIGGGDWADDRLIPDFIRAVTNNESLLVRYPDAIRPWQHVLALVHGYLILMGGLISLEPKKYVGTWNFGPKISKEFSVKQILEMMSKEWHKPNFIYAENSLPEDSFLAIDSSKAIEQLAWNVPWNLEQTVFETISWYKKFYNSEKSARDLTIDQIKKWRMSLK